MNLRWILALCVAALAGCGGPTTTPLMLTLVDAGPWISEEFGAWRIRALAQFTRETGIGVQLVYQPRNQPLDFCIGRLQRSTDDVYAVDVVWPGILAPYLIDLNPYCSRDAQDHFPAIVENNLVKGALVALPYRTDAGILFYRTDLLQEYGYPTPPATWDDLEAMAGAIQAKERALGRNVWGFVWEGAAYEGLTCNALEWQASQGGGRIIEADGGITVNNPHAVLALERAAGWIGRISPPGVISYREMEAQALWFAGSAVFLRDWPATYAMSQAEGSRVRGKFDVALLPGGRAGRAHTLGGHGLAISRRSSHPREAIALIRFLCGREAQRQRSLVTSLPPTVSSLYDDPEVLKANPTLERLKQVFLGRTVSRPSAVTGNGYADVSQTYSNEVHSVLSGEKTSEQAITEVEEKLVKLTGFQTALPAPPR